MEELQEDLEVGQTESDVKTRVTKDIGVRSVFRVPSKQNNCRVRS